jgi:hypothetical protein
MNKWKVALAGAVAAALALTGCAGGTSSSGSSSAKTGGTLTLGLITQATTFSAQDANWANEAPYMQAVYDTLIHANADGTIAPWLATKWSYDDTKTKLTLTLRTDVKFSDGEAFNADAAAQNLKRFRDGASPNKSLLAQVSDVKAVDASTVEIDLKAADPAILVALTQNAGLMESPKAFTASDIKTNPIGSGPYTLDTKNTVPGSSYTFVRNAGYWSASTFPYDKVVMKVFSDATAELNAIKGGQVSGANLIDNGSLDQIKAAGYTVNAQELDWTGLILLDRDGKLAKQLGDVKVRQAIAYAFNRDALLKAIDKGNGTVTEQIFPKSSPAYDASLDSTYTYDVAKAKQLLSDAGYPERLRAEHAVLEPRAVVDLVDHRLAAQGRRHHGEVHRRRQQLHHRHAGGEVPGDVDAAPGGPDRLADLELRAHGERGVQPVQVRRPEDRRLGQDDPDRFGLRCRCGIEGDEQVRRGSGLVRPVVPRAVELRDGRQDAGEDAGRERLPVPVQHLAQVVEANGGRAVRYPLAHPVPTKESQW